MVNMEYQNSISIVKPVQFSHSPSQKFSTFLKLIVESNLKSNYQDYVSSLKTSEQCVQNDPLALTEKEINQYHIDYNDQTQILSSKTNNGKKYFDRTQTGFSDDKKITQSQDAKVIKLTNVQKKEDREKSFSCRYCDKKFKSKPATKVHEMTH